MPQFSFTRFCKEFSTEEACVAHLVKLRWNNNPVCSHCGTIGQSWKVDRPRYWRCKACNSHFSITEGTPMEDSKLSLTIWFQAIYLIATSSKGVSAVVLSRQLGISYKTAWFLGHRIRRMLEESAQNQLKGILEVDEMYDGKRGNPKKMPNQRDDDDQNPTGRGGTKKKMIVTMVERGKNGRAKAMVAPTHSSSDLAKLVMKWGDPSSVLNTDYLPAYRTIGRAFKAHLRIAHSKGERVRVDRNAVCVAHTNNVEAFNSTIRRAIEGVWHWISRKHANRYLTEMARRWDMRKMDGQQRFDAVFDGLFMEKLSWAELTAMPA